MQAARLDVRNGKPVPKNRIEAISDGVFAVALTLLIVDLASHIPHGKPQEWADLLPKVVTFAGSFFAAGVYWVAHHNELNVLVVLGGRRKDGTRTSMREFLYVNLLFLMFIVMLPFSAAVFAENWGIDSRVPCLIYVANLLAASLALQLIWCYIERGSAGQLDEDHRHEFPGTRRRNWIQSGLALTAGLVEMAFPSWVAKVVALAVLPVYALVTIILARTKF